MSSNPEGLRIALARIAEENEKRTGFLDLGRLGLAGLPEVLFELDHLRVLVLGEWWLDQEGRWQEASLELAPNQLDGSLSGLHRLRDLSQLSIARTNVAGLSFLVDLTSLQTLGCNWTQVSDLSPLDGLTAPGHSRFEELIREEAEDPEWSLDDPEER